MKVLIGNTGLVGKTLSESIQFDYSFNSKNINSFDSHSFDGCELYLSCLPATKWLVNQNVVSDFKNIISILGHLQKFKYNRIILISTIDVYSDSPLDSDEDYPPNFFSLSYGSNRLIFENLILSHLTYNDIKIFRLPALFNKNIKKNIIFDLLHNNNIDQINLNSKFQWYNLDLLSNHINLYIERYPEKKLFNLFTEPLETSEIVNIFPQHKDKVTAKQNQILYNYKTKYTESGYIQTKEEVMEEIKLLVDEFISK